MSDANNAKTVAIKSCITCSGPLLENDRFCRWCGVRQFSMAPTAQVETAVATRETLHPSAYTTTDLRTAESRSELYRKVSGPLVSAVVASVAASASESPSRFLEKVILALISIPVWIIIVLLSPFDAYAAVRGLARQA